MATVKNQARYKRSFLGPALTVLSINIEGYSSDKATLLAELCHNNNYDIVCVQETHRGPDNLRPEIPDMTRIIERPHHKYGSAIYTRPGIYVKSAHLTENNNIEILTVELTHATVTSVYKPPNCPFNFTAPLNFSNTKTNIIIGDFNSHSIGWGYSVTDKNGEAVEEWSEANNLTLIHDPKLPPSFNSGRWKRGYNPDIIFVSANISSHCQKRVSRPIPRTQHRPISCEVRAVVQPITVPFRRRFNFKKAQWEKFATAIDNGIRNIEATPKNYSKFIDIVKDVSRKTIPRGCATSYVPGLPSDAVNLLDEYQVAFESDPFSENTISLGDHLMQCISESRREKWRDLIESVDMTHNSKKAWSTIKKLTGTQNSPGEYTNITANQVAHQLILNGKTKPLLGATKVVRNPVTETDVLSITISSEEMKAALKKLKCGKACGLDDLTVDQIKHLGPVAVGWVLNLFNNCLETKNIPKVWRKARVIALLKPGKPADDPKNFRPISLLCHLYKLFERILLARLTPYIDEKLIPEQSGFRPGKSCTSQILNLTQHIEDGFENQKITGVAFVDLSAAYDTVNTRVMIKKLYEITGDYAFCQIVEQLLSNRRFQVNLRNQKSRWRNLRNGLPQGSVLAPSLFNIYTNDQPRTLHTRRFIYADDLALAVQADTFPSVEETIASSLKQLGEYYTANGLKPNPSKTEVCAYHLRNKDANREINITWENIKLTHNRYPKYLGVTLDRSLTMREHCKNTQQKVSTRNNLLKKLTTTSWGAKPTVLRTTALALCYSAAEYACPVWERSSHAKQVDVALNESCRLITGCLKPTPTNKLYQLAGIAPPDVRRSVASAVERAKQAQDRRHPLFKHKPARPRLRSRKSFLHSVQPLNQRAEKMRINLWRSRLSATNSCISVQERLAEGYHLHWPIWRSLNRLRAGVGRSKANLAKWGIISEHDTECICGHPQQTIAHMTGCPACPTTCTDEELHEATERAIAVAAFWAARI